MIDIKYIVRLRDSLKEKGEFDKARLANLALRHINECDYELAENEVKEIENYLNEPKKKVTKKEVK